MLLNRKPPNNTAKVKNKQKSFLTSSTNTYTDKGLGFVLMRKRATLVIRMMGWSQFISTVSKKKAGSHSFLTKIHNTGGFLSVSSKNSLSSTKISCPASKMSKQWDPNYRYMIQITQESSCSPSMAYTTWCEKHKDPIINDTPRMLPENTMNSKKRVDD